MLDSSRAEDLSDGTLRAEACSRKWENITYFLFMSL